MTAGNISPRRKIGSHHLAFLRGQLQQSDLKKWWDTYLYIDGPYRAPLAKQTLRWITDELGVAARRCGRQRIEAVLRRDASRMPEADAPALEEYAQRFPSGFYSEAELTDMWLQEHGNARSKRKQRLIQRQLEALAWLETVALSPPLPDDPIDAWIEPKLAARLGAAGMHTIYDLVERMNGKGMRWWSGIRGVGQVAGERLRRWISENQQTISLPLGPHVTTALSCMDRSELRALRGITTAIVPLENFLLPQDLDGSRGVFRAPQRPCLLGVDDDYQAVMLWIQSKRSPHTQRTYRREAERLMLWAILIRGKALSSLNLEDCLAYQTFIRDPQPSKDWCGKLGSRGNRRFGPLWKPFEGPLHEGSERQALVVLKALYEFLWRQGYVVGNPWTGVVPALPEAPKMKVGHAFTGHQWEFVKFMLGQGAEIGASRRLVFAVNFLYATGLRLDELVRARLKDIQLADFSGGGQGWMIDVLGKGKRRRQVYIPDGVMELMAQYLTARGLPADPREDVYDSFLLGKIDDGADRLRNGVVYRSHEGIAAGTLYDQLKKFFKFCATEMARENPREAKRFNAASTHWLRHTFATHALADGMGLDLVQKVLGHANPGTTAQYNDAEDKRLHQAMQKFWKNSSKEVAKPPHG